MRILSALLILSSFPLVLLAQEAAPKVVKITFEGNKRYADDYLKEQISTKEGQPLDLGLLNRDEKILLDYFAAVLDIRQRKVEGGVELVIEVLDQTMVGKVTVLGSAVAEDDYKPLLSTRRRRPLLDYSLESDRKLLERLHREKGFHFVSVQVIRTPADRPNTMDVTFQVLPHNRVKVVDVILEGAKSIDVSDLLDPLESPGWASKQRARDLNKGFDTGTIVRVLISPYTLVRKLIDQSYYRRETVESDRRKLEAYYRDEGFLDAMVVLVGVRFDRTRSKATVHYRIDEGERYTVRALKVEYVEGSEPDEADREFLSTESLSGLATFVVGSPYRGSDVAATESNIRERLHSRAYAQSVVLTKVTPTGTDHQVDVTFTLQAGEKVRLGQLKIVGNRYTKDNVIRRAFRDGALPGQYLDIEALRAGLQRVRALRYFKFIRFPRGTQFGLVKSANRDRPDEYDVQIEVEEMDRTRQLELGGSIDTDGGATARIEVTWRNFDIGKPPKSLKDLLSADAFRGGGQQFTISLQPGTRNSTFALAFADPAVRDSRWSLSSRLFRTLSTESPDYDLTTTGVFLRVGRFLDRAFKWRLSVDWTLREVLLDSPIPPAPVNALDQQGYSSMHGVGLTLRHFARREAERFLNGHILTFSGWVYGLGADVEIVKLHYDHAAGWRLWRTRKGYQRVRVNFSVDWATEYGDTTEVPIWENFFLGGRNLRGFEFREVGPRSNGRPTGGAFMVLLSTEYTIPLLGAEDGIGIDLVLFLDQGGLSTTFDTWNSDSWRIGAGFGIAVSFELGGAVQPPLLIDFGWPIRKQDGDRKRLVSVSFVRTF